MAGGSLAARSTPPTSYEADSRRTKVTKLQHDVATVDKPAVAFPIGAGSVAEQAQ